jgi:cytochrome c
VNGRFFRVVVDGCRAQDGSRSSGYSMLLVTTWFAALGMAATVAQAADPMRGQQLYEARCIACHSLDENGPGPRHRGVYGCMAGTQAGYDYSPALRRSALLWNVANLDLWLADPTALVPGNKMVVRLANDPQDRADLIAYLKTATENPRECQTPNRSGR